MSWEHSTPTGPGRPQGSPDSVALHRAQPLGTEEAQAGGLESGQRVQRGLVQPASSHQIAGRQGGHLREGATEVPWGWACTTSRLRPSQAHTTSRLHPHTRAPSRWSPEHPFCALC